MKIKIYNKDATKPAYEIIEVDSIDLTLDDGTRYNIDFKFGELYIRKAGSNVNDYISILPKASNVISLK